MSQYFSVTVFILSKDIITLLNILPLQIHQATAIDSFKSLLKSHLM